MQGEWITETGVPAFRTHVRRDKAGNVLYEVTAADIPEVAANSARVTVELHGNKPPITEGHRSFAPDAKEADQPLVLGYLDNFRTGSLPDGTPAVLCDRHYMAQHAELAKRHPFCSVDYIHALKAIVGLAKLTRPPALNLGAVYYPGTEYPVYVYAMGDDPVDEPKTPDRPAAPAAEPAQQGQTPELTPEEIQGCEKVYAYFMMKYAWMKAASEQYSAPAAGPGAPQGNNTKPPSGPDDDQDKKKDEPDMSQADTAQVQKYEAELTATRTQLAALMAEREGEKVDRLLDQLEKAERYQFDRPGERDRMLRMTSDERQKRADDIRKYHHRAPSPERIEVYRGTVGGAEPETTDDQMKAAVRYATRHGVSYDEGLSAVKAGKK